MTFRSLSTLMMCAACSASHSVEPEPEWSTPSECPLWVKVGEEQWPEGATEPEFWREWTYDRERRLVHVGGVSVSRGSSWHHSFDYRWGARDIVMELDYAYGAPPDGVVDLRRTYDLDESGRVVRIARDAGDVQNFIRDAGGHVVETVSGTGFRCLYPRNADGNIARAACETEYLEGKTYTWDGDRPTRETSDDGRVREWRWTEGRLVEEVTSGDEVGTWARYEYGPRGELLSAVYGIGDAIERSYEFRYDPAGRVIEQLGEGPDWVEPRTVYAYGDDGWLAGLSSETLEQTFDYELVGDELTVTRSSNLGYAREVWRYRCVGGPVRVAEAPDLLVRVESPVELATPRPFPSNVIAPDTGG